MIPLVIMVMIVMNEMAALLQMTTQGCCGSYVASDVMLWCRILDNKFLLCEAYLQQLMGKQSEALTVMSKISQVLCQLDVNEVYWLACVYFHCITILYELQEVHAHTHTHTHVHTHVHVRMHAHTYMHILACTHQ